MMRKRAPAGVTPLDHTADVGMEVTASTLPALFTRAALGALWLAQGDGGGRGGAAPSTPRHVTLSATDLPALLRAWLRELLHWRQSEGVSFVGASFRTLSDVGLDAEVTTAPAAAEPVREIKGVTLHGLAAERRGRGWFGRVIFDV